MLYLSIMAVFSAQALADEPASAPGVSGSVQTTTQSAPAPAPAQTPPPPSQQQNMAPATTTEGSNVPASSSPNTDSQATAAAPSQALDCSYNIPTNTPTVDGVLVTRWAQKAAEQAFTFDYSQMTSQLETLKACFTDQGWQSFYDALKKSGNIDAINTQQLNVSAMPDGDSRLSESNKKDEWKIIVPLQVVYQNKQQKLTQLLSVELLVGRKTSGDLGIMQVIAQPRTNPGTSSTETSTSSPSTATPITTEPAETKTPAAETPPTQPQSATPGTSAQPAQTNTTPAQ